VTQTVAITGASAVPADVADCARVEAAAQQIEDT